jgi:hypothetical protein
LSIAPIEDDDEVPDDIGTAVIRSGGIASKTTAGILESEYEAGKITHRWYK